MTNLHNHLRPQTLARLIAELVADHADEMDDGEFNFRTDAARAAYHDLLAVGVDNCGEAGFFSMIEIAVDQELGRKETAR